MPTFNIKTDYGAKGDGQKTTATVTSSTSSQIVTFGSNLFTSGAGSPDIGKYIAIGTANFPFTGIYDTIAAVPAANQITLTSNAGIAFAGSSQTVEWGTNDKGAFASFATANDGLTGVILNVPDGRYCFAGTGTGVGVAYNISASVTNKSVKGLTIVGGSPTGVIFSDMLGAGSSFHFGGAHSGQMNDNLHSGRLGPAKRGDTTLTLLNLGDASRFSANSWAKLCGWDAQDDVSYPSNHGFHEFVFITAVSGTTITLQSPIKNDYRSWWPVWQSGNSSLVDMAGPPILYALEYGWDCDHEYIDINTQTILQMNCIGRNIKFTRGSSTGFGIYPSRNLAWTANDFDASNMNIAELDKINETITISGGTWHGIKVQSGSDNLLEMSGVHVVNAMNGTPKRAVLNNCTIDPTMNVGPIAFGSSEEFVGLNSQFNSGFGGGVLENDVFGVGAYSLANGIFKRAKHSGSGEPPQWAQPGSWAVVQGARNSQYVFQIIDVWEDGTNIYIQTNMTDAGTPAKWGASSSGAYGIATHACPKFTLINCTGSNQALAYSAIAPGKPMFSGWKLDYSGNIGTTGTALSVFGNLISAKFNVTTPFTGTGALTVGLDSPFVIASDGTDAFWNPQINLKVAGLRTITLSGVTGTQTGDSGLSVPDSAYTWLLLQQMTVKASADIGAQDPSTYPTVNIEILTDQGIHTKGFSCSFQ